MNHGKDDNVSRSEPTEDPVYRNARREALVALAAWVVAGTYTVTFCNLFGYDLDPAEVKTLFGVPTWVVWGIFAPWLASAVFCVWFSMAFIKDDDLGSVPEDDTDD